MWGIHNVRITEMLLAAGADPDARTAQGKLADEIWGATPEVKELIKQYRHSNASAIQEASAVAMHVNQPNTRTHEVVGENPSMELD